MIYTVSFNPALDYIATVEDFQLGKTNRTSKEVMFAGGKGINVSIVLRNLGFETTTLGYIAGFTGAEIKRLVEEMGITADFIQVAEGMSRINVKLQGCAETEINGMGPAISAENIQELYAQLDCLQEGDTLCLVGSIPAVMPSSMYCDIMEHLKGRGIRIVVDATRDLLVKTLPYGPFLIKPNNHELSEIFDVELRDKDEVIEYARKLQERGARNVVVSMAGDGAVFVDENGHAYKSEAPKGTVVNSVGAGDSLVAGFLAGYAETGDYKEAFRKGVCTGSASAFSEELATKEQVEALLAGHDVRG